MSSTCSGKYQDEETETEVIFDNNLEVQRSSIDPPISEWSSIEVEFEEIKKKKLLQDQGLYSPGSGELCAKTIALSNSSLLQNPYYHFKPVIDPGIKEALLVPEIPYNYSDDGQEMYLALCREMDICPVRMFHTGLVTTSVDISYYGVHPSGIRPMSMALQYNSFVEKLNLSDNFLDDDACYHLGQMLGSNTKLLELNMSGCRIGWTGLNHLGVYLHYNKSLKILNLARNELGEEGGIIYANMILKGVTVSQVNLSKNSIGRRTALALTEIFPFIDKITHLDLSLNNLFYPISTAKMLDSLAYSSILQELNLSWNSLEDLRVAQGIRNIMLIPTLTALNLSNNRFTGETISIIVERLFLAKKLVTLDLSFNPLSPNDALVALEKMLNGRVKLQNLFMTNVWVNETFHRVLARVKRKKCRRNFVVTFETMPVDIPVEHVDARELILKRADYLGSTKRPKVNVIQFFLNLIKEKTSMTVKDFGERVAAHRMPFSEGLIDQLAEVFPSDLSGEIRYISLENICEYMLRIWPDRMLPKPPKPRRRRSQGKSTKTETKTKTKKKTSITMT